MRTLLRVVFVTVLVVGVGVLVLGFWAGSSVRTPAGQESTAPQRDGVGTSGVDTSRAREVGAAAGARVGEAAANAASELGDAAITTRIKAKMALDEMVKARDISVSTEGSTVMLRGRVHSAEERDRAERLARETDGVTTVINELTIAR